MTGARPRVAAGVLFLDPARPCDVDGDEVIGYGFYPLTELAGVTIPRLANRIEHALAARHDGTTRYLENGKREPS